MITIKYIRVIMKQTLKKPLVKSLPRTFLKCAVIHTISANSELGIDDLVELSEMLEGASLEVLWRASPWGKLL